MSRRHIPYKWIVLSNTTLGFFMVMINASSLLIALPHIFRGIHLDPLDPGNFIYLSGSSWATAWSRPSSS